MKDLEGEKKKTLNTLKSRALIKHFTLSLRSLVFFLIGEEQKASWGYVKSHSHVTKC